MTRYAAFLRGVNLGRRTVRSADLKAAFEALGFTGVRTLLASGNVLFDADGAATGLRENIEAGLRQRFGFEIGTVLRTSHELAAMVASDPFARVEGLDAKLHVMLFNRPVPAGVRPAGVAADYDVARIDRREIFLVFYAKPDGTYTGGSTFDLEKRLPRGTLVTMRNWNTILKAVA